MGVLGCGAFIDQCWVGVIPLAFMNSRTYFFIPYRYTYFLSLQLSPYPKARTHITTSRLDLFLPNPPLPSLPPSPTPQAHPRRTGDPSATTPPL